MGWRWQAGWRTESPLRAMHYASSPRQATSLRADAEEPSTTPACTHGRFAAKSRPAEHFVVRWASSSFRLPGIAKGKIRRNLLLVLFVIWVRNQLWP